MAAGGSPTYARPPHAFKVKYEGSGPRQARQCRILYRYLMMPLIRTLHSYLNCFLRVQYFALISFTILSPSTSWVPQQMLPNNLKIEHFPDIYRFNTKTKDKNTPKLQLPSYSKAHKPKHVLLWKCTIFQSYVIFTNYQSLQTTCLKLQNMSPIHH